MKKGILAAALTLTFMAAQIMQAQAAGLTDRELYGSGRESIFYNGSESTESSTEVMRAAEKQQSYNQPAAGGTKDSASAESPLKAAVSGDSIQATSDAQKVKPEEKKKKSGEKSRAGKEADHEKKSESEGKPGSQSDPEITVTGIEDHMYYARAVKAEVMVESEPGDEVEASLQEAGSGLVTHVGLTRDGNLMRGEFSEESQGDYQFSVRVFRSSALLKDRTVGFVIDSDPPVISLDAGRMTGRVVSLSEMTDAIKDSHPDIQEITVDGQDVSREDSVDLSEGQHDIYVTAYDKSGNSSTWSGTTGNVSGDSKVSSGPESDDSSNLKAVGASVSGAAALGFIVFLLEKIKYEKGNKEER